MGVEYALKLSGAGAKNLTSALWSVASSQEKTKGKTRLVSLLKSGKELKVFNVTEAELSTFAKEAKRYGVLYTIIKGVGDNPEKLVDVMVKAEDAAKINRIVERLEYGRFDETDVVVASQRELQGSGKQGAEKGVPHNDAGAILGELLGERTAKEGSPQKNPPKALAADQRPSEPSSKKGGRQQDPVGSKEEAASRSKTRSGRGFGDERDRPSVKAKIEDMRKVRTDSSQKLNPVSMDKQTEQVISAQSKRRKKQPTMKGR